MSVVDTERQGSMDELDLLMDVIHADGEVRDEELDVYVRVAREYGLEDMSRDMVRRTIDEVGARTGAMNSAAKLPRPRRNMIVRRMIEVARADGELHASERALIQLASERLLNGASGAKSGKLVETV